MAKNSALLYSKTLSVSVVANVLLSGLRERVRQSDPVRVCGAVLAFLAAAGNILLLSLNSYWAPTIFHWFDVVQLPFAATAAAWSVYRGRNLWLSWHAGLDVGWIGNIPNFIVYLGWVRTS